MQLKIMMRPCKLRWICAEMIKIQVGRWMTFRLLPHFFYRMTLLLLRELLAQRVPMRWYLLLMEMLSLRAPRSPPVLLELRSGTMILKITTPWQSRKRKSLEPIGSSKRLKERNRRTQTGRNSLTATAQMIAPVLDSNQRSSKDLCLKLWWKKLKKRRKRL